MRRFRFHPCGNFKESYRQELDIFETDFGRLWMLIGLILLFGVVPLISSPFILYVLNTIGIYAIAAIGLNLLIGYYFARYLLPLVPFVALFAADAVTTVLSMVQRTRLRCVLVTALVVATIGQPLAQSVWLDALLTREDTRTLAKMWIEERVPEGSRVAVDWSVHGPPLSTAEWTAPYSKRVYDVLVIGGSGLSDHPLAWYREQGVDYLVSSSFTVL